MGNYRKSPFYTGIYFTKCLVFLRHSIGFCYMNKVPLKEIDKANLQLYLHSQFFICPQP